MNDPLDLGLAFANRSACFQKLGGLGHKGLRLSLSDIQLALGRIHQLLIHTIKYAQNLYLDTPSS